MTDDILDRATRAHREAHDGESPGARMTELRILETLQRRERARRARIVWLVPLAAVFLVTTAWAGATGQLTRLAAVVSDVVLGDGSGGVRGRSPPPPPPSPSPLPPSPSPLPPSPSPPSPSPPPSSPLPPPLPRSVATRATGRTPPPAVSPTASTARAPDAPPEVDTDALYRVAHQAHFGAHDPAAALAAWDRYLAAAPAGTFAPEARYNRAITLVRLGRRAEARAALQPFASGEYGTYRRDEAERLLRSLDTDR